jgi:DNA invertase Pin-like site-specific DNA recombinase
MATTPTPEPRLRAGCYCRISSDPNDKREGTDRQREDTADICTINGWVPAGYYVDDDRSASNGRDRPEWKRLLGDIEAGRINAIVVWNQDRGWRKMADLESLRPLLEPRGVLLATTNIGVIDFRNADDVFRAQVSTAMSEMEIAKMRVRMRRAARQKAERGKPQWKAAFGYVRDTRRKEDDDGTRKVDKQVKKVVEQAYKAVLAGASLGDIARTLNKAELYGQRWARPKDAEGNTIKDAKPELHETPWTASTVSLFLRKPRNAGLRDHNDELVYDKDGNPVKGTWPPLVDENLWKSVQHKLNEPGRAPGRKTVTRHLLTGVLQCGKPGCGGYLSGYQSKDGVMAYRCRFCRGVAVRFQHVEPLVYQIVSGRLAAPDAVDLLKAELHDVAEAEALRTEENTLRSRLNEIADERADGLLDGAQAKRATERVKDKLAAIERRQQDQERLRVLDGIPLGTPQVAAAIQRLSPDRFRAVVELLMAVTVMPVGKGNKVFNPDRVVVERK